MDSLTNLSKGRVPATYSYDPAAEEYVVYEQGSRHIYESKQAFETNWARIKRPFVPHEELAVADAEEMEYAIIILPDNGSTTVYSEGRTYPIDTLREVIESQRSQESQLTALKSVNRPEIQEIADDPDAVVGQFAAHQLSEAPDGRVAAGDVYAAYEQWAEKHGIDPDTKSWFARRLNNQISFDRTTDRTDGNQVRYYEGIELTEGGVADR